MYRRWAFWRRTQYVAGVSTFFALVLVLFYFSFFYSSATCFDGTQNGDESGVDCGGSCQRICSADVAEPVVRWSREFRITNGLYNAVAYVENRNQTVGTRDLKYTFTLYDNDGEVITERSGTTILPPDSVYPIFEGRIAVGEQVPTKTFITFEEVDDWQEMDVGREQFVVENRELINVDSQPRLDATLNNTLLRDERDVEVVATIFDSSGNALTTSRTFVPLFEGRSQKRVVFTWPEPISKTLRSCEVPTDVILAIDLSGSMNNDSADPPEPISSVLTAAESFVNRLRVGDQAGVVTFATFASLERNLSGDINGTALVVSDLSIDPSEEVGSTNIGDPIIFATKEFASPRHDRDARKVLVLLTDGIANAPDEDAESYAQNAATEAKNSNIIVYTIGLGNAVNKPFLAELASSRDHQFLAADTRSLDTIYRTISTSICEEGPSVIDIVPKVTGSLSDT